MDAFSAPATIPIETPFSQPTANPLPDDPLQSLAPGTYSGLLIYNSSFSRDGQGYTLLHLLRIGSAATSSAPRQSVSLAYTGLGIFGFQVSPDGRQVLVKVGDVETSHSTYSVYFWDFKSPRLDLGPKASLTYLLPQWSPDSRSIAYVVGGTRDGFYSGRERPIQLFTYNLPTHQEHLIVQNVYAAQMAWSSGNTLLYTAMPEAQDKEENPPQSATGSTDAPSLGRPKLSPKPTPSSHPVVLRPAIYESSADGGKAKVLIHNGYSPAPSPDGKWIAFYGWPDTNGAQHGGTQSSGTSPKQQQPDLPKTSPTSPATSQAPAAPELYLYRRTDGKRFRVPYPPGASAISHWPPTAFGWPPGSQIFLRWTPDSGTLLILRTSYYEATGQARLSAVHIPMPGSNSVSFHPVAVLQTVDSTRSPERPGTEPQFDPIGVSSDSRELFIKVEQVGPIIENFGSKILMSLQAVNLENGSISSVCRPPSYWFDWHAN